MSEDDKLKLMEERYRDIIEALGEDVGREGLVDTPLRAAKAMRFITGGVSSGSG